MPVLTPNSKAHHCPQHLGAEPQQQQQQQDLEEALASCRDLEATAVYVEDDIFPLPADCLQGSPQSNICDVRSVSRVSLDSQSYNTEQYFYDGGLSRSVPYEGSTDTPRFNLSYSNNNNNSNNNSTIHQGTFLSRVVCHHHRNPGALLLGCGGDCVAAAATAAGSLESHGDKMLMMEEEEEKGEEHNKEEEEGAHAPRMLCALRRTERFVESFTIANKKQNSSMMCYPPRPTQPPRVTRNAAALLAVELMLA